MKRKLLSILLALCMVLTLLPTMALAAGNYNDTKGHWAEKSIDRWSDHEIVQGSNGSFAPNDSLTRGQMAVILCRLLNLPAAPSAKFTDVDEGAWYADAIDRCAAAGIMLGADGKAMPNEPISREQSMVMLCRALGIAPVEEPDLSKYADADQISDYAKGYVAALIDAGIINGVTDDTVAPQDDINRASTVTILDRAIIVYADEPGQTVEANGGIVIVAADNVTVTGEAGSVIVAAPEGNVTLDNVTTETVTVTSEGGNVTLDNSTVGSMNVNAANTGVEAKGNTTVETVSTKAENTEITTSGKSEVGTVSVGENVAGTTVNAGRGTTIGSVENAGEGTTVTGNGKVENVSSSTDVTVETKGTEVTNSGDSEISVTDKTGKESSVDTGASSTTSGTVSSGGGGGSSSSSSNTPSHSHSYDETTLKCTCGQYRSDVVATVNDTNGYTTLEAAIGAAENNQTVKLLKDVTLDSTIFVAKSITLDLNGKTVTAKSGWENTDCAEPYNGGDKTNAMFVVVCDNKLIVNDSSAGKTGTITTNNETNAYGAIKLTAKTNNDTSKTAELEVNGGTIVGTYYGIVGNGNRPNTKIVINGGTIKGTASDDSTSIYHPQGGELTITGGTLEGATGLYVKSGTVTISGDTTIKGTGTRTDYVHEGNGFKNTGDALVVEACDYPGGHPVIVNISGGTFSSTNGNAIGYYKQGEGHALTNEKFITGGTFSTNPSAYLAANYGAKLNDGKYVVSSHAGHATVTPTTNWTTLTSTATCETCGYVNKTALAEADYFINTKADLDAFAKQVNEQHNDFNGKTVKLMADIDYQNGTWLPVAQNFQSANQGGYTNANEFRGTFDGNNKTISNIKIEGLTSTQVSGLSADLQQIYSVGFFGYLIGTVKDLNIDNATVTGYHYVGAIAGMTESDASITGCHVTNAAITCAHLTDVQCGDKAGGIVGNLNGSVSGCTVGDSTISAGRDAGQVVGCAQQGSSVNENCTAASVTVSGGLIAEGVTQPTGEAHCATSNENITNGIIGRDLRGS